MDTIDLSAIFLIGFLSSFSHCLGMCGGFVMAYAVKDTSRKRLAFLWPHVLYNTGRVITYSMIGAVLGWIGEELSDRVSMAQALLFILAGAIMVLLAVDMLGWMKRFTFGNNLFSTGFKRILGKLLGQISGPNMFFYGLILGFIPCGLVAVAGAKAIATGSVPGGMLTMFVFGLGTIPALFLLGLGTRLFTVRFRNRVFRLAAIFILLFGLLTVIKGTYKLTGTPIPGGHHSMPHISPMTMPE
ncbi:MAG: sulfite exporter TauE/SafE family protein [Fidelibacterota bacterium]